MNQVGAEIVGDVALGPALLVDVRRGRQMGRGDGGGTGSHPLLDADDDEGDEVVLFQSAYALPTARVELITSTALSPLLSFVGPKVLIVQTPASHRGRGGEGELANAAANTRVALRTRHSDNI